MFVYNNIWRVLRYVNRIITIRRNSASRQVPRISAGSVLIWSTWHKFGWTSPKHLSEGFRQKIHISSLAVRNKVRSDINSHGLNTLYKMTENLTSKSGVANETARMQAIKMLWYEYDLADRIDKTIAKVMQKRDDGLNRESELPILQNGVLR